MLDSILGMVKDQVGSEIMEKTGVDAGKIDDIMGVVGGVAAKEAASEMAGGGLDTVMNLFSSKGNSSAANSLQEKIGSGVVEGLIKKLGFDEGMAKTISGIVLPIVMKVLSNKNEETSDDDSSALQELFGAVTGKGSGKGVGMLGNVLGGFLK